MPDGRDSIEPRQDCDEPIEVRTGKPGPDDEMGTVTAADEADPDATIDVPADVANRAVCSVQCSAPLVQPSVTVQSLLPTTAEIELTAVRTQRQR